ncbi:sigma-70 family RNA polymerase sigma factor [Pirellulaceae bacterium SH501]
MLPDQSHDESYEEFLQYFLRDQSRIFAYVRSLLPQYSDAQDVFQRCSLTLWKQFDRFDRERLFLPWACGIAFNEVRNFRRVSGRDRLLFSDDLIEQLSSQRLESLSHRERRSVALRACIESLKQADRDLVRSIYQESHSVNDIATSTGRAAQTIYNRLSVLRRTLLQCIEKRIASEEAAG